METVIESISAPLGERAPRPTADTRTFLPYLEGMRGFFGLYIGIMHVLMRILALRPGSFPAPGNLNAFSHNAIAMFIVISGYVLGLPVARDGQTFRGGIGRYVKRRALRIVPAYYAALLVSIPIAIFITDRLYESGLTTRQLIASTFLHAFMLHNLSNSLIATIDAPMWSIAMECDCYILFPLLLVPLARRLGFPAMVGAAFAIGLLPVALGALRHQGLGYSLSSTCPWYIGLFALGYAAANFSIDQRAAALRQMERWSWQFLAILFALAMLVSLTLTASNDDLTTRGGRWLSDVLIGFAIACQFIADARARKRGHVTWFERFFRSRALLFAGAFSYSYYLIHLPVIDLIISMTRPQWSLVQVYALGATAFVITLVVAYGFYRIVERPFMTSYRRRGDAQSLNSSQVTEIADATGADVAVAT